jgi:predicted O-methyltransferase YrrM
MPGLTRIRDTVADALCATGIAATLPLLRFVASHKFRESKQKFTQRLSDAAEIAILQKNYYTPIVTESDIKLDLRAERDLPGIELDAERQIDLINQFTFREELAAFPVEDQKDGQFFFGNRYYPPGDSEFLYSFIRLTKPRRMIEIGSGFSTLIAHAAFQKNASETGFHAEHICIEPFEHKWLEGVGPEIIRKKVEDCGIGLFKTLGEGDILFVDSTHVIRPQGDVLFEFQHIIPQLNPGVVVHVHDIFTPRDYPPTWVLRDRRLWNEQYLLEAFLCHNSEFEIICALNWLKNNYLGALTKVFPALAKTPERQPGAFWFKRKSIVAEASAGDAAALVSNEDRIIKFAARPRQ